MKPVVCPTQKENDKIPQNQETKKEGENEDREIQVWANGQGKMKHTKKFWYTHPKAVERAEAKKVLDTTAGSIIPPPRPRDPTVKDIVRDAHGRITKGYSGNLAGMPPGTPSLVRLLKARLAKHPEDAEAIVTALIKLGKTGDMRAIEQLIDRIDGKVIERHQIEGEHPVYIHFVPAGTERPEIEAKPLPQLVEGQE